MRHVGGVMEALDGTQQGCISTICTASHQESSLADEEQGRGGKKRNTRWRHTAGESSSRRTALLQLEVASRSAVVSNGEKGAEHARRDAEREGGEQWREG